MESSTDMSSADPTPLSQAELDATTSWLAAQQKRTGEIPWYRGGKMDPWDHVHAAMALTTRGRRDAARAAYRFLASTQDPNGGWAAERRGGRVTRITQEANHAAYVATGVWHFHRHRPDADFLAEMWPSVERAIDFVVGMQLPNGAIAWAQKHGKVWRAPLLTGSSSIHGSLVCAARIAERLGFDRPAWRAARARLARAVRDDPKAFTETDLPNKPGEHAMDWYYPVLGGAVRGEVGHRRMSDPDETLAFVEEGVGCRCVRGKPWYTIAETCELVLALDAAGVDERARRLLAWTRWLRTDDGAYWTGATHPDGCIFPDGEKTTWTAASVLIATDAMHAHSATSRFFRELDERDLAPRAIRPRADVPSAPGSYAWRAPAE